MYARVAQEPGRSRPLHRTETARAPRTKWSRPLGRRQAPGERSGRSGGSAERRKRSDARRGARSRSRLIVPVSSGNSPLSSAMGRDRERRRARGARCGRQVFTGNLPMSGKPLAAGRWPLAAGKAAGRWPLAAGRWPLAAGRWPLAAGRWPLAAGRWPLAAGRWPLAAGRWPLAAGRWPLAAGRWPLAAGRWPLAAGRWPQIIHARAGDRCQVPILMSSCDPGTPLPQPPGGEPSRLPSVAAPRRAGRRRECCGLRGHVGCLAIRRCESDRRIYTTPFAYCL